MKTAMRVVGKVQIIGLSGRLVLGETEGLERAFKGLLADQQSRILIDLHRVPYMDSSGIGEVAACKKRAKEKQVTLKLLKKKSQYDLSVEFMLDLMYPGEIFEDEREALASF
jgi:anti-anti-sigma factor